MKRDEELGIELEERIARVIRRPIRQAAVPPFDQVRRRADRRGPTFLAVPSAVAVIVLAMIVGGALAERRAPGGPSTSQPTPTVSGAGGVLPSPSISLSPSTTAMSPVEAAAWQRVRDTLPASGPVAMPTWLPPSIDRTAVEIRELTKDSYLIAYRGDGGSVLIFAMGARPVPSAERDAGVGVRLVRRSSATLSFPQSVFDNPTAKALRRVQWQEGDRWLRIESEDLRGDDLVRVAWSLDLATAPAPAHPFIRGRAGACASADPEATLRTFLTLAGSGDVDAALDCYALERVEVTGASLGQGWANLPKATFISLERRADSGGRAQLLVSWTFAGDPGGAWGSPATYFFLLTQEGGVYRIGEMGTAPLGPYP